MKDLTRIETYIIEDIVTCMWSMNTKTTVTAKDVHSVLYSEGVVVARRPTGTANVHIDIGQLHRDCDSLGYNMEELMFQAYARYKTEYKIKICEYKRDSKIRKVYATAVPMPYSGGCGFYTTTDATKTQLLQSNSEQITCSNCKRIRKFIV